MIERKNYVVGDIFKIFDKGMQKYRYLVLSRFVFKAEHFVLLSLSTFERWTDRELTFRNEFEKTSLEKDEVLYLTGDDEVTFVGNVNSVKAEMYKLIEDSLCKAAV